MTGTPPLPTRSALLELREERLSLSEGYRFLDEKRLILAAEILAEIGRYERLKAGFDADSVRAVERLRAAVVRHGLAELSLYPVMPAVEQPIQIQERRVLGVALREARLAGEAPPTPRPTVDASPEGDACRAAFSDLLAPAVELAAVAGNLERLRADYARTARRARALEDVLLPEVDEQLRTLETVLDELAREESGRARLGWTRP